MSPSLRDFRGCLDLIRASRIFSTLTVRCPISDVLDLFLFDNRLAHIVEDNARVDPYEEDTILNTTPNTTLIALVFGTVINMGQYLQFSEHHINAHISVF